MEELWLAAPCPALRIQGAGRDGSPLWRVNDAAVDWGRRHDVTPHDWETLARRLWQRAGASGSASDTLGARQVVVRCRSVAMESGLLVWLDIETPPSQGALSIPLDEQLALAQRFGRLGLWERNVRTGAGRWDRTMFELFGIDPAAGVPGFAEGMPRVHPDDRARMLAHHEGMAAAGPRLRAIQFRVVRPDGTIRHLHSIGEVRSSQDGRPELLVGVQLDVTETVERIQLQQRKVAYLDRAVDLADLAIWRLDHASGRMHFNERGSRLLGLPDAPAGLSVEQARSTLHPDDRAGIERASREAAESDRVVDSIARYRAAEGGWRTVLTRRVADRDARGEVIGLAGVALDITDLEAERARAASMHERLVQLADALGFGMWTRDAQTQHIEWDAQMYRLYRRPPESGPPSMQEFFERYVHPLDAEALRATQTRSDQDWVPEVNTEFRIQTPDGVRWIAAWTRREDRNGRRTAFGAHLDVTERHNAAVARREKKRAEQASREQAEFVARVSHELRTPLNAVLGFAQLLSDDSADPLSPGQRERLRPLLAAGTHLRSLLDDTLDLTRAEVERQTMQIEPVNLAEVCGEAVEMARALAERHSVTLHLPPRVHSDGVLADRRRLMQVVTNLITNAVKYNRPGGWVRLDTDHRQRNGFSEIALVVRDSGHGMSPQQLSALFEPFNRLGAERRGIEGTGIGLTIVRQFTERMGGSVAVVSQAGQGSEFRVWLPAVSDEPDRDATAPAPFGTLDDDAPRGCAVTVLCVEDNDINLLLMKEMFSMRPEIRLLCESDGRSGIAAALLRKPDLILLDLHLPDMHGLQVLERLRQDSAMRGVKIIALSANAMPADVRTALAAGFDDYWTKPIDFPRFIESIDAIVAGLRSQRGDDRPAL